MDNLNEHHLSFLRLPTELRSTIYEYLIPNDNVSSYWSLRRLGGLPDRRPVRHDQQPCCPAILRVNRQIHDEVIGMFYGTARFEIHVIGCCCYVFSLRFCTEDLDPTIASKLPPNIRFIRSMLINMYMQVPHTLWYGSPTVSELPPLPLPAPGTTLLARCLSTGSYELRQVTFCTLEFSTRQAQLVVENTVEDRGRVFNTILKRHLAPLRILRGVDLKLNDLCIIGHLESQRRTFIRGSAHPAKKVLAAIRKLNRIRMHFLRKLAEQISQHA